MASNVIRAEDIKVLVVDDDPQALEPLLRQCHYNVISITRPETAVDMLVENKDDIDLAIINVDMPGLDGFVLLKYVDFQLDMPAIMLSSNGHTAHIMKGLNHGACDHLIKPVRIQEVEKIWTHVVRRKKLNFDKSKINEKSQGDSEAILEEQLESAQISSDLNNKSDKESKEDEAEFSSTNTKKSRLVWTRELHAEFVEVVTKLGIDKAVPKKVHEMMSNKSLTRAKVASHLQKYRLSMRTFKDPTTDEANNPSADHDQNIHNFEPRWYQEFMRENQERTYRSANPNASNFEPRWYQEFMRENQERTNRSPNPNASNFEPKWYQEFIQENQERTNRSLNPNASNFEPKWYQEFIQENQERTNWSLNPNATNFSSVNHEGWPRAARPISYRHHDQAPSSDDNTPTFHRPINQAFSHGNTSGVPRHQQGDDQFFQGDHLHGNDQGFDQVARHVARHVARRDNGVRP